MSNAAWPKIVAALCVVTAVAGCRTGAERDLVQRELRQQEDQIYALEDYLAEYQDLLCDARQENARLKRQAVQGQFREGSAKTMGDPVESMPTPPLNPPTDPSGLGPEELPGGAPPAVPSLDLSEPAVPPVGETSRNELSDPRDKSASEVQLASAEEEVAVEQAPVEEPAAEEADSEIDQPSDADAEMEENPETQVAEAAAAEIATAVVLRGEVQLGEEAAGPRVLLEVAPVTGDGKPAEFAGRLSILVLDPAAPAKQQQLARWDFAADELAAVSEESPRENSFEFPLQLPAESPADRSLELWVRLVDEDGAKILGRTTFDATRPSQFASAEVEAEEQTAYEVEVASAEVLEVPRMPKSAHRIDTDVKQSGWQTAKPGEVTRAVEPTSVVTSEWKMATRPVPTAVATPMSESKSVLVNTDRYRTAMAPDWTPERPRDQRGSKGRAAKSPPIDHIVPPSQPSGGGLWGPTR